MECTYEVKLHLAFALIVSVTKLGKSVDLSDERKFFRIVLLVQLLL